MAEDFTQRATCECYYKFENAGDLGEDNQNQIDLTNHGVTQSSTIPDTAATYCGVSATKSASFVAASVQYLDANHDDSIEIDDITAVTAFVWVYLSAGSTNYFIYEKGGYYANGGHNFYTYTTGTKLRGYFADTVSAQSWAPDASKWYCIAFGYSQATDEIKLYVGDEENLIAQIGSAVSAVDKTVGTTYGFSIGAGSPAQALPFDGLMCEFAIFSEELSLAEIQEIQADGMEGTPAGNPYYAYAQQ